MSEEELNINLTEKQKIRIWKVIMIICLIIAIYFLISGTFRAGSMYVCNKMGGHLQLKPEYRCWFEEEERIKELGWLNLLNVSGED